MREDTVKWHLTCILRYARARWAPAIFADTRALVPYFDGLVRSADERTGSDGMTYDAHNKRKYRRRPRPMTTPTEASKTPAGPTIGSVVAIYTAPAASVPVQPLDAATLIAGVGIEGDRYVRREGAVPEGHWDDRKWEDQQISFIEAEKLDAFDADYSLSRRNVVTRGIVLADLHGKRFAIGAAIIEGIRVCSPCMYMEGLSGRPGMRKALGDGGLRAAIVQGGVIRPGDEIRLLG